MSGAPFKLVPLDATHDRALFNCDSEPLNRYLKQQVTQDIRRRVAACFVALADPSRIAGYYTLASAPSRTIYLRRFRALVFEVLAIFCVCLAWGWGGLW